MGREHFGRDGLPAEEQMKVHQDSALWLMPMVEGNGRREDGLLQAPNQRQKLLVVTPPKIFGQAGITKKGERLVLKALSGLNTSPKDWGSGQDHGKLPVDGPGQ